LAAQRFRETCNGRSERRIAALRKLALRFERLVALVLELDDLLVQRLDRGDDLLHRLAGSLAAGSVDRRTFEGRQFVTRDAGVLRLPVGMLAQPQWNLVQHGKIRSRLGIADERG